MHRTAFWFCLVITVLSATLIQAADCCSLASEKIRESIKYAEAQNLESFEVDLGTVNPNLRPVHSKARSNRPATNPTIVIFQNGINSHGKDTIVDYDCWDLFWDYTAGHYVYLGVVVANYESMSEAIQVVYELQGPKNKTIKKSKSIPERRVIAYFVRLRLASDDGTYLLTSRVLWRAVSPFALLDETSSYTYVNHVL